MITHFLETPVQFDYKKPTQEEITWLQNNSKSINVEQNFRIKALHSYKEIKLKGVQEIMSARKAVVLKLNEVLEMLPKEYRFFVFDAFRTKETQLELFNYVYHQQKELNSDLTHEELFCVTKEFIVHPFENQKYPVPPHNSGGAIDLTLSINGAFLDMGTEFDAVTSLSNTNYFEQDFKPEIGIPRDRWIDIRKNRRLLFNTMKHVGFINYEVEWWHYDLGDCLWADEHNLRWYFPSMETESNG